MTKHAGCGLSANTPSQVGFVWKVEQKKQDGSLLIGYEYSYDLLGRVEQSVERPSGDVTAYTYTPAGRLESEVCTGQVAYSRSYAYNPDGSRAFVIRDDALNGSHWDFYAYDAVSGRLESVLDVWTGEVNSFVWNPEGTLARWENHQPNSYARVFGYDEEGRLVRIERDYGNGNLQLAYVYGYNSDGVRVWKQDVLSQQEYRYVCRIGCGGIPMRVYGKLFSRARFTLVDTVLSRGNLTIHQVKDHHAVVIELVNSMFIMPLSTSQYQIFINDSFNISVGSISYPFILLPPRDIPYPFIPSFPRPPIPLPDPVIKPLPWHPIKPVPVLPLPMPPNIPPSVPPPVSNPNPLPPPSNPIPPWVPPVPPTPKPPSGAECDKLRDCLSRGEDCFAQCQECCDEFCGPGNYPKCYGKCMESNDFIPDNPITDCGPMIIDSKPKFPEDLKDFIEMICELLKAWGLIDDDEVPICKVVVVEE